jgi:poly(3-hydroxybutyrate) depolymerase
MKNSCRILALLIGAISPLPTLASDPLPALHADPAQTSISGLSSGAFMAVQYQVAFSRTIKGAGIVAGGPYYCAAGSIAFTAICMGQVPFMPPNPALMVAAASNYANLGRIDPLENLKDDRIYVFSGTRDTVVYQQAVDATVSFFKQLGVDDHHLKYANTVEAGHALITPDFGNDCAANAAPYISHCKVSGHGYDQAGEILQHIYGQLSPAASGGLTGKMMTFRQREFAPQASGMSEDAFAYIPQACSSGTACKVHIALHGCMQSASQVGDDYYADTGYNRWADSNHIIMLYPQVDPSTIPFNPKGCWDWFGYTGPDYATQNGMQIRAIKAMVDRLTSGEKKTRK